MMKRNGKFGKMRVLVTGNLGYIGPVLSKHLKRSTLNKYDLTGYDIGFFQRVNSANGFSGDTYYDRQIFSDVRDVELHQLEDIDVVVYLAAISNDPMGNKFEKSTLDINYNSAIKFAEHAKKSGVKKFVFASSCSVYGSADDQDRKENSELNPLTAYAKSKVNAEIGLKSLASDQFQITCLRFATACGWSDRIRLDLVLNDFVCGAYKNGIIEILSDGSPWRPLIHVKDMSRAIEWSIIRENSNGGEFCVVNVGSNDWNLKIKDLAYIVQDCVPGTEVKINPDGQPDKRSYRVSFEKFQKLAPDFLPLETPKSTVQEFLNGLTSISFDNMNYRSSDFIRLIVIQDLLAKNKITDNLERNEI
jgi:nucleoside-diphosphate-sugar epimerase